MFMNWIGWQSTLFVDTVSWKDRIKEHMHVRGADRKEELEQAWRECLNRDRWRLFCSDNSLGGCF